MSDPNNWSSALNAYEDRVKALEKEIDVRERDTLKLSDVIKVLMEENDYLKNHIHHKNKEIQKVLETIALNDAEAIKDLNHRLKLSQEESDVILSKFQESENHRNLTAKKLDDREHELDKLHREYKNCRGNLAEALAKEEVLTTQNQTLNVKLKRTQENLETVEKDLEEATNKLNKLQNKHELTSNQLENSKRKMEEFYESQDAEVNDLAQRNVKLLNENEELQKQVKKQAQILEKREKEAHKMNRDLSSLQLEDEEYIQKMLTMKNELTHETRAKEAAQKNEKILEERNAKLELQLQDFESKLRIQEREFKETIETSANEVNKKNKELEAKVERLKEKMKDSVFEKEEIISHLKERIRNYEEIVSRTHNQPSLKSTVPGIKIYDYESPKDLPNSDIAEFARQINRSGADFLDYNSNRLQTLSTPKEERYLANKFDPHSYSTPNIHGYNDYNDLVRKDWIETTAKTANDYQNSVTEDFGSVNLREVKSAQELTPFSYKEDYSSTKKYEKKKRIPSHKEVQKLVAGILNRTESSDTERYRSGSSRSDYKRPSITLKAVENPSTSFKPSSPTKEIGIISSSYYNYRPANPVTFRS